MNGFRFPETTLIYFLLTGSNLDHTVPCFSAADRALPSSI